MRFFSLINFILISGISANAQNNIIEYQSKINKVESNNLLIIGDTLSYWTFIDKSCDEAPVMSKNYKNETVDFSERLFNNTLYIRDSLHKISWSITNDTMTILNQFCQSAKTEFRGRQYVAYFSTIDKISNGPWKFGGLPGMILSVKSLDGFLEMIAINSRTSKQLYSNKCTTSKSKFISWEDYKLKFINAMDSYIKLVKSNGMLKDNSTLNVKIDAPEIIYPKVQIGEGFIIK